MQQNQPNNYMQQTQPPQNSSSPAAFWSNNQAQGTGQSAAQSVAQPTAPTNDLLNMSINSNNAPTQNQGNPMSQQ